MKAILKSLLTIYALLGIASCKQENTDSKTEMKTETQNSGVVELKPDQIKAIGLEVESAQQRNLKTTLKVNGKLMLPPQNKAQVSVFIGGIVKDILVQEGALVNKGQALAIIENTDFLQLQQDYLENKAQLNYASKEYDRQKELQKDNINSAKSLQQAEADFFTKQAKDKAMEEKLKLFGLNPDKLTPLEIKSTFSVIAPISGNIRRISVNIGKYAEPNKELFDIVDNRFLHIDLTVYEQDIHKLKEGQKLTFTDANDPTHVHTAIIYSINKAFEDNQQAVIAHAKIEDITETLLSGMFIEARIQIDNYSALTLPTDAIVSNGNEHYIFVQSSGSGNINTYKMVSVRIGASDMGFTEIATVGDISSEKKVVVKGAYYLLSELTKGEGEHHD